jgi:dynactin-5
VIGSYNDLNEHDKAVSLTDKLPLDENMASTFLEPVSINQKEYAFTDSGNVISRAAKIYGAQNIVINGRSVIEKGCIIRGDLRRLVSTPGVGGSSGTMQLAGTHTSVNSGRYLAVGQGSVLRPPGKMYKG